MGVRGTILALAAVMAAIAPSPGAARSEAIGAFQGIVEICKRPGRAPEPWLGPARAAGWAPPGPGIEAEVVRNIALARALGAAMREAPGPPPADTIARIAHEEADTYAARQQTGLNEVYVHDDNPDRIVRISPGRLALGLLRLGDPVGAYCFVTFVGDSADNVALPAGRRPFGGLVDGAFSGQIANMGADVHDTAIRLDPNGANGGTPAMLFWGRVAPGARAPGCRHAIAALAKAAGEAPFELPDCARLIE